MEEDTRNLTEEFKYFPIEIIKQRLAKRRRPFATLVLNIEKDLNLATMIRNHNAFCGQEFFYLGRKKYNRRGTVGTHCYETVVHLESLGEALEHIPKDYTWVGIDNRPGSVPMNQFDWPDKPLLVYGHEQGGLDYLPELIPHCQSVVMIPQIGSVRSLNVGCASAVSMYDLCAKKGWLG